MTRWNDRRRMLSATAALLALAGVLQGMRAEAAQTSCLLKAATEPVEVTVLVGGTEYWHEKIPKGEERKVAIPEGPFTVISSVYNQNLKTKEDIRTEAHTQMCGQQAALNVPLFVQR
ncbi:MAG TPA: hypothetical protein VFS39_00350 [Nitrospira sp.]|nr:hypothetical protein [Nitrospira sp.]